MTMRKTCLALIGLILGANCAHGAAVIQDIGTSKSVRSAPSSSTAPVEAPTENPNAGMSLQDRVQRLERSTNSQALVEMLKRVEELQVEVQNLRSQVEEQTNSLEAVKSRQRDIYVDIDRRLQQVEGAGGGAASAAAKPADMSAGGGVAGAAVPAVGAASGGVGVSSASEAAPTIVDGMTPRQAYEKAFDLLRKASYEQSIAEFQRFLHNFPQSEFAGNAQYWLGEANYQMKRFDQAIVEFKKAISTYPTGPKVADAHLKLGYTYYQSGKWAEARQNLNEVKTRFSGTSAARLAEQQLNRMVQEGH